MIGPIVLPAEYEAWNRKWHAPHGRQLPTPMRRVPDLWDWKSRYQGPFAFQPNNSTRSFEYPWAFHVIPLGPGTVAVDLGGGVSGFQFTLAKAGAAVTNVDPFLDYGSVVAYETIDPQRLIDRLNKVYRTDVRLIRHDLVGAALASASVDVVYCISMLEHLNDEAQADALREIQRILRPGGHLVMTVDLFLDLEPFTDRASNRYGTNVDIKEVVERSGLTLVVGDRDGLLGYPEFDAKRVQSRLADFLVGVYPALTECFVLRQS